MKHAIERTSPKGESFRGTCWQCGRNDLPMSAALEECENIAALTEAESLLMAIEANPGAKTPWPDPTPEMLDDPLFDAIWQVIKSWDINVPAQYPGYCGATGNHARAILDAVRSAEFQSAPPAPADTEIREALKAIRRAIMEDTTALNDTLWMPDDEFKGGSVVDFIDHVLNGGRYG